MDTAIDTATLLEHLLAYEALALDHEPVSGEDSASRWDGVAFSLQQRNLCVDVALIDEIIPPPDLTAVPGSAAWLLGLTNVRGSLVTIVDLRMFLGQERSPINSKSRILVSSSENQHIGLLVDEILGQRHFDLTTASEVNPEQWQTIGRYLSKVYQQDGCDWGIFDLVLLLQDPVFLDGAA